MTPPSPHAIGAILLTAAMFYGFVSGRARVEIISLLTISAIALGLYSFPLPGQAPTDGLKIAFQGFGHYALITICALMVLGRGLVTTGALEPAARLLTRVWRFNRQVGLLVTLLLAMGMSMMVNDTPVLVLLLPVMAAIAANGGMAASKTLIPVNSAVLIGGMATTIGTSTNLLVVSIATDLGLPPMTVFHFTPIVLMAAVVALPFIWLVMPRLLPDNSIAAGHEPRRFAATLRLSGTSAARDMDIASDREEIAGGRRDIGAGVRRAPYGQRDACGPGRSDARAGRNRRARLVDGAPAERLRQDWRGLDRRRIVDPEGFRPDRQGGSERQCRRALQRRAPRRARRATDVAR